MSPKPTSGAEPSSSHCAHANLVHANQPAADAVGGASSPSPTSSGEAMATTAARRRPVPPAAARQRRPAPSAAPRRARAECRGQHGRTARQQRRIAAGRPTVGGARRRRRLGRFGRGTGLGGGIGGGRPERRRIALAGGSEVRAAAAGAFRPRSRGTAPACFRGRLAAPGPGADASGSLWAFASGSDSDATCRLACRFGRPALGRKDLDHAAAFGAFQDRADGRRVAHRQPGTTGRTGDGE